MQKLTSRDRVRPNPSLIKHSPSRPRSAMNHLEDYTDILESIPTDLCHPLTQILQLDSETQSLLI